MKQIIEQDYQKDKQFEAATGVKVIGIKESGNGLLNNFTKHGVTLTQLRKKDKRCVEQFEELKGLLKKISEGTAMKQFDDIKVDVKNSENYKELIKKYDLLAQIFEIHLEPSHKKIIQEI